VELDQAEKLGKLLFLSTVGRPEEPVYFSPVQSDPDVKSGEHRTG